MSTTIFKKLLEIKKEVPYLKKDKKGFNYTYVTPTQVCATINPLLIKQGLFLQTSIIDSKSYEVAVPTKNDPHKKEWKFDLDIVFSWIDVETGERVDIPWKSSGCNGEDKGLGSALTYAERYFLLKQFNIPTDNDDPDAFQNKYTVFEATQDQWNEANELIKGSTLDANGRQIATDALSNAGNLVDWQKIIVGLRKRQVVPAQQ